MPHEQWYAVNNPDRPSAKGNLGSEGPLGTTAECCVNRGPVPESHVTGQHSGAAAYGLLRQ